MRLRTFIQNLTSCFLSRQLISFNIWTGEEETHLSSLDVLHLSWSEKLRVVRKRERSEMLWMSHEVSFHPQLPCFPYKHRIWKTNPVGGTLVIQELNYFSFILIISQGSLILMYEWKTKYQDYGAVVISNGSRSKDGWVGGCFIRGRHEEGNI